MRYDESTIEGKLATLIVEKYGSRTKFYDTVNVSNSTLNNIFSRGVSKVGDGVLQVFCDALGISFDALREGSGSIVFVKKSESDTADSSSREENASADESHEYGHVIPVHVVATDVTNDNACDTCDDTSELQFPRVKRTVKNGRNRVLYCVDSENVASKWVDLLNVLHNDDKVYVFYTDKTPNMTFETMMELVKRGSLSCIEWIKCYCGCNALDFQLVSVLSCEIDRGSYDKYVIFSNDLGYDAVVKWWKDCGIKITRSAAVAVKNKPVADTVATEPASPKEVSVQTTEKPATTVATTPADAQVVPAKAKATDDDADKEFSDFLKLRGMTLNDVMTVSTFVKPSKKKAFGTMLNAVTGKSSGADVVVFMHSHAKCLAKCTAMYDSTLKNNERLNQYINFALNTVSDIRDCDMGRIKNALRKSGVLTKNQEATWLYRDYVGSDAIRAKKVKEFLRIASAINCL